MPEDQTALVEHFQQSDLETIASPTGMRKRAVVAAALAALAMVGVCVLVMMPPSQISSADAAALVELGKDPEVPPVSWAKDVANEGKCMWAWWNWRKMRHPVNGTEKYSSPDAKQKCRQNSKCKGIMCAPGGSNYRCYGLYEGPRLDYKPNTGVNAWLCPPKCPFKKYTGKYLEGYAMPDNLADDKVMRETDARNACLLYDDCTGVTCQDFWHCTVRSGKELKTSKMGKYTWMPTCE